MKMTKLFPYHAHFFDVDPHLEVVVLPPEEGRERDDDRRQPNGRDHRPHRPQRPAVDVVHVRHGPVSKIRKSVMFYFGGLIKKRIRWAHWKSLLPKLQSL